MNFTTQFKLLLTKRNLIIAILFSLLLSKPSVGSWNDASRMATIQSIVEHGTLAIDDSVFNDTGDKVLINGHFYSDKPIFAALLGAIVYFPLFQLGIKLNYEFNLAYYIITLFTVKLFYLLGLLAFHEIIGRFKLKDQQRSWLVFSLAFASLYFSWSSTFNNHLLAASHLIIGLNFLLKAKEDRTKSFLLLSGLFFSLAGAEDLPMMVFYVGFFIYLLFDLKFRRYAFLYIIPSAFTILPTFVIFYSISGSFLPLTANIESFLYPSTLWVGKKVQELTGREINKGIVFIKYAFNSLLGYKGFILYNPLLFIAIPNLYREIKLKRPFWREALVIGSSISIITLFYLLFSTNYSGNSYSIRWFVPYLPLLFIFLYPTFKEGKSKLFISLTLLSLLIAVVGIIDPWSKTEQIHNIPFIANILELYASLYVMWFWN